MMREGTHLVVARIVAKVGAARVFATEFSRVSPEDLCLAAGCLYFDPVAVDPLVLVEVGDEEAARGALDTMSVH